MQRAILTESFVVEKNPTWVKENKEITNRDRNSYEETKVNYEPPTKKI